MRRIFKLTLTILVFSTQLLTAQVAINENNNNPDASAMLDVSSTDKGILIPRMESTARENISNPANGLMVFDNTTNSFWYYSDVWQEIGGAFVSKNGITYATNQEDDFVLGVDSINYGLNIGSETKLFFSYDKAAFRVGSIGNENWDIDSLGFDSFAGGSNAKASGSFAFAYGSNTEASGLISTAMGYRTIASGNESVAMGRESTASGLGAVALGWQNTASGDYAYVSGFKTRALGNNATAMGSRTTASGKYAFAAGDFSNASGDYSSSFGNYNYAPSYGEVAMGVFNVINIPFNTDDYDARDRLLVVGNGQSPTNRSNALVIYKSGNMELNGALTIDDAYTFPTTDGTTNQVLTTDGNGTLSWKDETANLEKLEDTDGDTKVQVEANSDEDIIRFALGGIEYMRLDSGRIEILNTGNSVFMGAGAGVNDNLNDNFNVFIGDSTGFNNISGAKNIFIGALSGYSNTTGRDNTFIGENAGYFNTSGEDNTFIGRSTGRLNTIGRYNTFIGRAAGFKNSTGSDNIFIGFQAGLSNTTSSQNTYIGYQAGQNAVGESNVFIGSRAGKSETGSHKLYIENSDTASPLIYGDFLADSLQINGKLNINGGYTFPTADGSSGQFLQTDGSGNVSWTSQQTFTDTDNQTIDKLNLNGTTLELSLEDDGEGDQTVNLATLQDDLGDHNATQNIQLSGNWLSNDGGNEGLKIDNTGKVGIGTGSPGTLLDLGDGSGSNTVLLRLNTERSWQFEQTGSGANTNLRLKSNNAGKNYNIVSSDGSVIASFRADGGGNNNVGINKSIGTNDNALEVNGNASKSAAGDWLANSDARLKKNIQTLNSEQVLKQLLTLQGITYEWNDDKTGNDRPEGMQYGFTAQNVQEVFPTLVSEDSKGYLQTSYGTYDAMYVEALRALNEKIEDLERENEILKAQIAKVNQLEAMFHQLQAKMEADSDVMNATIAVKK